MSKHWLHFIQSGFFPYALHRSTIVLLLFSFIFRLAPYCSTSLVTLCTPPPLPPLLQTAASNTTIPCQACHTPKQDLLWLPLNYTLFYSTVYQSKGGAIKGYLEGVGVTGRPQYPLHQCLQPPQKLSWQRMSSYNAVAVPAAQSHPIPNCPERWQIMERLWSENGCNERETERERREMGVMGDQKAYIWVRIKCLCEWERRWEHVNEKSVWWGSYCRLSHCAHRSREETEVWDGHSAGVRVIHLPASSPPHPLCLQHNLQAPVSPWWCVLAPLFPLFTSYPLSIPSFHPFFIPVGLPISLSVIRLYKLTKAPPLGLASGSSHTSNMPGILCAALHSFTWRQGDSSDLHTKRFSFIAPFVMLFGTVPWIPFFIVARRICQQALKLTHISGLYTVVYINSLS